MNGGHGFGRVESGATPQPCAILWLSRNSPPAKPEKGTNPLAPEPALSVSSLSPRPAVSGTPAAPAAPQGPSAPPLVTDITVPGKKECFDFEPGAAAAKRVLDLNGTPAELTSAFPNTPWLGAFELPDGRRLASPFLSRADMDVTYGSGDLAYAKKLTAGTGFAPVTLRAADGTERAAFQVLSLSYKQDTLNQPYHEAAVGLLVAPEGQPVVVPDVNGYSNVAAIGAPGVRVMSLGLVLDKQEPIDWGRKVLGLDKRPGAIAYQDAPSGRSIHVADEKGRPVFELKDLALSQAEQFQEAPQMAAAFGVPLSALASLPTTVSVKMVHRDVNNGRLVGTAYTTAASPEAVFNLAKTGDHFSVGDPSSPLARILERGDFQPEVYWHDPKALFSYGAEASVPTPPPVP